MTSDSPSLLPLDEARRDIDAIDDALLELLAKRFAVTERVRQAKAGDAKSSPLPIRPTRETQIMRRLVARAHALSLPPEFLVRLWRGILSQSSLTQSRITLHVSRHLAANVAHRLRLRDHFGVMPVEQYRDEAQALTQINAQPSDLCIVETEQPWAEAFIDGRAGAATVIAALPVLTDGEKMPRLLVLGEAATSESGEDETLVITAGKLPRDFVPQPLWQGKSGNLKLAALPGFLLSHESPLVSLSRSNSSLGLRIAGHYSRAIAT